MRDITPRECWDRRKITLHAIYKEFGTRKFNLWFDPQIISVENCLAAILTPVLEHRGEKLCLKNIETTDVYCMAKQLWGKIARISICTGTKKCVRLTVVKRSTRSHSTKRTKRFRGPTNGFNRHQFVTTVDSAPRDSFDSFGYGVRLTVATTVLKTSFGGRASICLNGRLRY